MAITNKDADKGHPWRTPLLAKQVKEKEHLAETKTSGVFKKKKPPAPGSFLYLYIFLHLFHMFLYMLFVFFV